VPIVGSVETVLEQMLEVIRECGFDNDKEALADWWSQINQWRSRHCLAYEKSATQIKPQQVIETLYKVTQGQAFVASDVGPRINGPHVDPPPRVCPRHEDVPGD
jgi:acetolactate synthase-1/2/3 large subunit